MSFCILIPTINRKDLLEAALKEYALYYPKTKKLILDNGNQNIEAQDFRTVIYRSPRNLGVAGSWNFLINRAIEQEETNFLILNDDVILKKGESIINDIINSKTQNHPYYNNFYVCYASNHWSSYILNKQIYEEVGEFDENFKRCFYEDNDYAYRMKLKGINYHVDQRLNPEVFLNNGSTIVDPTLRGDQENREYFVRKWGGMPNDEKYLIPFNE
jgi:GT2 family glycosyltransferase